MRKISISIILLLGLTCILHFTNKALLKKSRLLEQTVSGLTAISQEIHLHGNLTARFGKGRLTLPDVQGEKTLLEECTANADKAFADVTSCNLPDYREKFRGLEESWKNLAALRDEILMGRDALRNQELAAKEQIAFNQELLALLVALNEDNSRCNYRIEAVNMGFVILALLSSCGLLFYYFRDFNGPVRRIADFLAAGYPDARLQSSAMTFPGLWELEEDLHTLKLHSRENTAAQNTFFASMGHEIRTPLNGIIGFLENMEETNLNQQQMQYLNVIRSSAENLLRVIDELMDFSKISAGRLELDAVAFDAIPLLEDRLAFAAQLARHKKNVKLNFVKNRESLIIRSDPMRLRQVVDNLLSNAVKFTERGEILLSLEATEQEGIQANLRISVKDSGIGMSSQELGRVFEPYSQASGATARRYGGTGLGLAISSSIVKLLGGELTAGSRPGEGSVFSFSFAAPLARQEEQLRLSGDFQIVLPVGELKKKFALLVDDTPTNLFLLETICQGAGLPYRTAQNGLEALQRCREDRYDIVFMDIQMPVMDGYTAIRQIRELPDSGTTHIVALTASAYQEDVERALAAGANSFIPKPFERNQLLLCIGDALDITPQRIQKEAGNFTETAEEATVRRMHGFMGEQYRISLGEIKMILAQTAVDWRPLLDDLDVYLKKGMEADVRAVLHRLKGQLSSIGLRELADLAENIMKTMDSGGAYEKDVRELADCLSSVFKVLEKQVTLPGSM